MHLINKREASDWAGCLFCLAFVGFTVYRLPRATLAVVPLLVPDLMRALAFLVRGEKSAALPGLAPRIASYLGSYTAVILFDSFSYFRPHWTTASTGPIATIGVLLMFPTTLLTAWAVWHLRHSFSIEPQARALVTSGPYGIWRHPIYILYFVQTLGIWLAHRTVAVAIVVLISTAFQATRMFYEERVLSRAFPEYADYRNQVDIFGFRALLRAIKSFAPDGQRLPASHATPN